MSIGADIFVSAALQPVFERLFKLGEELIVKLGSSGDLAKTLRKWKTKLRMIKGVLVDAEHKQFQSEAVKEWVDELQDLAFGMEDVLEDFAIKLQDKQLQPKAVNMVTGITNNLSNMFIGIGQDIQEKMKELTERLEELQGQSQILGLSVLNIQPPAHQTEALRDKRESSSLGSEVFGRDGQKKEIIRQLLEGEQGGQNYALIPIVGMGGIGKTTLAQYVYNDDQVQGTFESKAWVCVSDVFDVKQITTAILEATVYRGTTVHTNTLEGAQTQLKQALTSKKFLIVLDDIWNEEYEAWYQLQIPFQHAARGSRVIVTTRNKKIASMMNTNPSHNNIINLKGLSGKDCWRLFQLHANNDSNLAEFRDDIIKKCKGLPLAAKALGGLFRTTKDMKQRRVILESDAWRMDSSGLPALRVSYLYLPSHLKHIFAYCSVLPKDYKFTKKEVILLWMAQDFLPENKLQRMEDLGDNCFNDLVSRSLFEQCSDAKGKFIMHDLVHDLALWAAGKSCYLMDTLDISQVDWQRIRHVFFTKHVDTTLELPMAYQWRTFYSRGSWRIKNLKFLEDFRYIRTLRLASYTIKVLPECIGELKHLRFLELQCGFIEELPQSISNLWNLQTLCLQNCDRLEKVPNIGSLEKLRHLKIGSLKEMPMGFEKLTNLQSLDKFILRHGHGARLRELEGMNNLEDELVIDGLENVSMVEDASKAQLKNKCRLDKLTLIWGGWRDDELDDSTKRDVLKELEPPSSIKKCKLEFYSGLEFPAWLGDSCFKNMVDIELSSCMKCEWLPPLGQLPWLESLSIQFMDGVKKVGTEFYGDGRCSNPFPTLKSLHFGSMKSWEKWEAGNDGAFPCLERLKIVGCDSLQEDVPTHLPSLKRLEIWDCKELRVSLPSLPSLEKLRLCNNRVKLILRGQSPSTKLIPFRDLSLEMPQYISRYSLFDFYYQEIQCFPQGALHKNPKTLKITDVNIDQVPSLPSSLSKLHIQDCPELESFEDDALPLQLTSLRIHKCPKLQFSVAFPLALNLTALSIRDVLSIDKSIRERGFHSLTSLKQLDLQNIGYESGDCTEQVQRIPNDLQLPSSLSELEIAGFQKLKSIRFSNLPNLLILKIWCCPELESFEDEALPLQLSSLFIKKCPKLQLSVAVPLLLNLKTLTISSVLDTGKPIRERGFHSLTSLEQLDLQNVGYESGDCTEQVRRIPDDFQLPSSLSALHITGFQNLESIGFSTLPNLVGLNIKCCPELESFEDEALPLQLASLNIEECPKLQFSVAVPLPLNLKLISIRDVLGIDKPIREWGLHLLTSLELLDLENVGYKSGDCTEQVRRIPEDLELPSSLFVLRIVGFQNLESIGFSTLPHLILLEIRRCPHFSSFKDNALPTRYLLVIISECDLIKPRLKKDPCGRIAMDADRWSLCSEEGPHL